MISLGGYKRYKEREKKSCNCIRVLQVKDKGRQGVGVWLEILDQ